MKNNSHENKNPQFARTLIKTQHYLMKFNTCVVGYCDAIVVMCS